jgi:hypothetical protein
LPPFSTIDTTSVLRFRGHQLREIPSPNGANFAEPIADHPGVDWFEEGMERVSEPCPIQKELKGAQRGSLKAAVQPCIERSSGSLGSIGVDDCGFDALG